MSWTRWARALIGTIALSAAIPVVVHGMFRETEGMDDEQVIEQRIRNRIIEYLELASSFDAQIAYERAAPIVNVPYEVINQWEDQLPNGPSGIGDYPKVYTADEVEALNRFHGVWKVTWRAVPDDHPSFQAVQAMPEWEQFRREAEHALAVLARRGKLDEDQPVL
jgi:hypothetical protein